MNLTNDLHIEKEILPLFDYTINQFARQQLSGLFQWENNSLDEIKQRQQICKGFVAQPALIRDLGDVTYDFLEVRELLMNETGLPTLQSIDLYLPLYNSKRLQKAQARLNQAMMLLSSLHNKLFSSFSMDLFPDFYRPVVEGMLGFLKKFKDLIGTNKTGSPLIKKSKLNLFLNLIADLRREGETERFYTSLSQFEAYLSIATAHNHLKLIFPEVASTQFSVEGFFHPLLKSPVRNDFTAKECVAILSGPNMSGKSTLLKSLGLCVYLSHLGFGIPAAKGSIPYFDSLTISLDSTDDLAGGFSQFMTEVRNVKSVALAAAGGKACFAVFDELYKGTNAEDALEIFDQTVKGLVQYKNSVFIISTHLPYFSYNHSIKKEGIEFYHLDCDLMSGIPQFNFRLMHGWSDVRVGSLLFKQEGMREIFKGKTDE